jgi:hypothetical protein
MLCSFYKKKMSTIWEKMFFGGIFVMVLIQFLVRGQIFHQFFYYLNSFLEPVTT